MWAGLDPDSGAVGRVGERIGQTEGRASEMADGFGYDDATKPNYVFRATRPTSCVRGEFSPAFW